MANNRLFLHCDRCGADLCLAKHMGEGWYTPSDDMQRQLDDWFDEHTLCTERMGFGKSDVGPCDAGTFAARLSLRREHPE
jgi:hypothetical protein